MSSRTQIADPIAPNALIARAAAMLLDQPTVNRTRSALYSLARFLSDYQAVQRGGLGRRLCNKAIGRNLVRRLNR
jgi:hypothetical protein